MREPVHGTLSGAPPELTAFFGRREELEAVRSALAGSARLVTVTGPGGVGKSRVALRAAHRLRRIAVDGIWYVDVARYTAPVDRMLTQALKLESGDDPVGALIGAIGSQDVLIVLDNCEAVVDEVARLVLLLLAECPGLRFLITSREVLGVPAEVVVRLGPLGTTGGGAADPAVALFVDRATTAHPAFAPGDEDIAVVERVCVEAGGLPLAIELAAARMQFMSLPDVAAELTRLLDFTAGRRTDEARRADTMRGSIALSWELCDARERRLWAALSLIPPGWGIGTAEALAAGVADEPPDAPDAVLGLLSKSIVTLRRFREGTRYEILPPLRVFGREQVDDETAILRRHAQIVLGDLQRIERRWLGPDQDRAFFELREGMSGLRQAIASAERDGDQVLAARLATTAWRMGWQVHGDFAELVSWLTVTERLEEEARGLAARVLAVRAVLDGYRGRSEESAAALEKSMRLGSGLDERSTAISVLAARAELADDPAEAVRLYEDAMAVAGSNAFTFVPVNIPSRLAIMHRRAGDRERSAAVHRQVVERCRAAGDRFERSSLDVQLATLALLEGVPDEAIELTRSALRLKRGLNDPLGVAHGLEVLAGVAGAAGDQLRAATLLGASSARWRSIGAIASSNQPFFPEREAVLTAARQRLGPERFGTAFAAGARLDEDAAIRLALGDDQGPAATSRRTDGSLTPRERDVVALVAEGLSNKAIAARLTVSVRTAEAHVQNALVKLGFRSRTELVSWYARQGAGGSR